VGGWVGVWGCEGATASMAGSRWRARTPVPLAALPRTPLLHTTRAHLLVEGALLGAELRLHQLLLAARQLHDGLPADLGLLGAAQQHGLQHRPQDLRRGGRQSQAGGPAFL
jgi:hypothetical protein